MMTRSQLDHPSFGLDPALATAQIVDFLRLELLREPRHSGYVVGLSGGIDSALTAALVVEAAGRSKVTLVLLPEEDSQPRGVELAREIAQQLGTATLEHNLTPALRTLGVYEQRDEVVRQLFPDFKPNWLYRLVLPGDLRESRSLNLYQLEVVRPDGERARKRPSLSQLRILQASTNVKQRLRMTLLYREAESRGALVAGTTNRTELAQGFFVRYGDGGVDVEPLAHLYKAQVRALSAYLGLPAEVIERAPSPDTWSAPVDDGEFYFRLPYDLVDRLLAARDHDMTIAAAAEATGLEVDLVTRVYEEFARREKATARLHELPPSPITAREVQP